MKNMGNLVHLYECICGVMVIVSKVSYLRLKTFSERWYELIRTAAKTHIGVLSMVLEVHSVFWVYVDNMTIYGALFAE